jgi:hypothetical protein
LSSDNGSAQPLMSTCLPPTEPQIVACAVGAPGTMGAAITRPPAHTAIRDQMSTTESTPYDPVASAAAIMSIVAASAPCRG